MPPLFLVGGLAGRLLTMSPQCPTDYGRRTCQTMAVPYATSALSPTLGPRFASCVWLYHCASSPSRRLLHVTVPQARPTYGRRARRSHKAYGRPPHSHSPVAYRWTHRSPPAHARATLPALLLVGGPAGRLPHMAVLLVRHAPPPNRWARQLGPARRLDPCRHPALHSLRLPVGPSAACCTRLSRRPPCLLQVAPGGLISWPMHALLTQASRQVAYLVIAHQRRAPSAHGLPAGLACLLYVLSASAAHRE